MIDYSGSTRYFSEHQKAGIWSQAGEATCTRAIAHARRVLARGLGRALDDSEPSYTEGDSVRDEYAVYEQAVHMIENGAIANGQGSAPVPIIAGSDEDPETPRKAERVLYAAESLRWLGYRGTVTVSG